MVRYLDGGGDIVGYTVAVTAHCKQIRFGEIANGYVVPGLGVVPEPKNGTRRIECPLLPVERPSTIETWWPSSFIASTM